MASNPPNGSGDTGWKIERTIALLVGYRRLTVRYERHGHLFTGVAPLAAALICYKKLARVTT
ncbi:transposase [Actinomadura bangladeshensis]|uniref:Transposase n=1 Tax=Actinomadura bangladeshensis TaxID=453573 RepID=A0A6L9QJ69_9ACTN|nr:transposase [Actinomadura bangladeshensis]NED56132.1 transposase [Micromonospora aurantiaca]